MISIIICSRTERIRQELFENIEETIGVTYELIVIDNSKNQYSIFEAYNLGIKKSKGIYLCFIHDDILIHTRGWGEILTSIFRNHQNYGLIGVAGSSKKTKMPSGWWDCQDKYKSINIVQHYPGSKILRENLGFENSVLNEVVFVDGVFLALRKETNIIFNEKLKGYHNYDLNLSIETIKKNYKVGVTNKILIEHFSIGNLNHDWIKSTIKAHKFYKDYLPLSLRSFNCEENEIFSCKRFVSHCLNSGEKYLALKYSFNLFFSFPISKANFIYFIKTLKKNIK
ncbi:glycosyltransferase involved in cell wall biosynthesis [Flavobacterium sp. 7E]|uniref:glycosyltransferase n=1 Tax=Flavobacterium sp. 7E TaxID=2735898 RepID=UPI00156FBB90|nr:glycosyltransferase [Flavobacterium sp. 7E]NRS89393.1 glycosyltransferase involved in cell wall biosynthesis [Flavobacterium sp. 7E]